MFSDATHKTRQNVRSTDTDSFAKHSRTRRSNTHYEAEKEISSFSECRSRRLKPVDLLRHDSGCPRDVDVATSPEQTTIEGLPSSRVMERENEDRAVGRVVRFLHDFLPVPAPIRLLISQRGSIFTAAPPSLASLTFFGPSLCPTHVTLGKFLPRARTSDPQSPHLFTSAVEAAFG